MPYIKIEPEVAKLLESPTYPFIRMFSNGLPDILERHTYTIEYYALDEDDDETPTLNALIISTIRKTLPGKGAMDGFYVHVYESISTYNRVELLYSFERLEDALKLIEELKTKIKDHFKTNPKS